MAKRKVVVKSVKKEPEEEKKAAKELGDLGSFDLARFALWGTPSLQRLFASTRSELERLNGGPLEGLSAEDLARAVIARRQDEGEEDIYLPYVEYRVNPETGERTRVGSEEEIDLEDRLLELYREHRDVPGFNPYVVMGAGDDAFVPAGDGPVEDPIIRVETNALDRSHFEDGQLGRKGAQWWVSVEDPATGKRVRLPAGLHGDLLSSGELLLSDDPIANYAYLKQALVPSLMKQGLVSGTPLFEGSLNRYRDKNNLVKGRMRDNLQRMASFFEGLESEVTDEGTGAKMHEGRKNFVEKLFKHVDSLHDKSNSDEDFYSPRLVNERLRQVANVMQELGDVRFNQNGVPYLVDREGHDIPGSWRAARKEVKRLFKDAFGFSNGETGKMLAAIKSGIYKDPALLASYANGLERDAFRSAQLTEALNDTGDFNPLYGYILPGANAKYVVLFNGSGEPILRPDFKKLMPGGVGMGAQWGKTFPYIKVPYTDWNSEEVQELVRNATTKDGEVEKYNHRAFLDALKEAHGKVYDPEKVMKLRAPLSRPGKDGKAYTEVAFPSFETIREHGLGDNIAKVWAENLEYVGDGKAGNLSSRSMGEGSAMYVNPVLGDFFHKALLEDPELARKLMEAEALYSYKDDEAAEAERERFKREHAESVEKRANELAEDSTSRRGIIKRLLINKEGLDDMARNIFNLEVFKMGGQKPVTAGGEELYPGSDFVGMFGTAFGHRDDKDLDKEGRPKLRLNPDLEAFIKGIGASGKRKLFLRNAWKYLIDNDLVNDYAYDILGAGRDARKAGREGRELTEEEMKREAQRRAHLRSISRDMVASLIQGAGYHYFPGVGYAKPDEGVTGVKGHDDLKMYRGPVIMRYNPLKEKDPWDRFRVDPVRDEWVPVDTVDSDARMKDAVPAGQFADVLASPSYSSVVSDGREKESVPKREASKYEEWESRRRRLLGL